LGDITVRALETFKTVDYIACEDTRHTLGLLTHFEIRKPLISCRAQNEQEAAQKIIGLLSEGKNVAYASDAGTPGALNVRVGAVSPLADAAAPGIILAQAIGRAGAPAREPTPRPPVPAIQ